MASTSDISAVRLNTDEPTNVAPFTDDVLGVMIDALGVTGASARVWSQKAASFSGLVDVTEAGASHKASDLFKHASAMMTHWSSLAVAEETPTVVATGPRVSKIQRVS